MSKLVKILGVLALLLTTVEQASAASFLDTIVATASTEDFVVENLGPTSISLSGLFFSLNASGVPNLLNTNSSVVPAGLSFSEVLNNLTVGATYNASFTTSANPLVVSVSLSPVPLPAGFPLFAMALLVLGSVGYFGMRKKTSDETQRSAA
jgi:hypothetical protein